MSHIHIRNLTVSFGNYPVLRDITLDIPDGQIVAIIGPSGCGKTTLLKCMNRLLDLQEDACVEGEILIDGRNIYANGADVLALRKKVGFLSQRPYPLPMSIFDNVAFGMRIHGLCGRRAAKGEAADPVPGARHAVRRPWRA
jgi:phosphate transport system ATP-binding protein